MPKTKYEIKKQKFINMIFVTMFDVGVLWTYINLYIFYSYIQALLIAFRTEKNTKNKCK